MKHATQLVRLAAALVALALVPGELDAQGPYAVTLAQVDTTSYPTITLHVNVRDSAGQPVGGLRQEDMNVTEDGTPVEITDFAGTGEARPVDIVFVFDTTGSMTDEIEGVKQTCIAFAQKLQDQNRDYRLGLVAFGDSVRGVFRTNGDLTESVDEFKGWIETLHANGGDGDAENDFGALKQASALNFRSATQRIIILITDAPPHHFGDPPDGGTLFNDPDLTADRTAAILTGKAITLYAVTYDHPDFHKLVEQTNGEFFELTPSTDFTGIIDKLGTTIASQYRISYRSPRPTYDGTHRDIEVAVRAGGGAPASGGTASGSYVEQHLVNIRSNVPVALMFLAPLLLALVLPLPFLARRRTASASSNGKGTPLRSTAGCPHCGRPLLRPEARFCNSCGQPVSAGGPAAGPPSYGPAPIANAPALFTCPRCGASLRAAARFCPRCGLPR
ncbi:MAG: VWA domain-containing protein [Chloroflexi bacterium]|nr:VWA domain-containing protein [Chloroflexota bacterium]